MADLTVNLFVSGAVKQTLVAATAGGDSILSYDGKQFLIVNNAHATLSRTITLDSQEDCNQEFDHDLAVVIPALETHLIKAPPPPARWKDSGDKLQITYSDAGADITIGAFKWPD